MKKAEYRMSNTECRMMKNGDAGKYLNQRDTPDLSFRGVPESQYFEIRNSVFDIGHSYPPLMIKGFQ